MKKLRVLFVCSGPGVRGRIAEAFLNQYDQFKAESAQFEDRQGNLPSLIIQLMEEVGTEISTTFPKSVFERYLDKEGYDYVITLCHAKTKVVCPVFRSNVDMMYNKKAERLSWSIQDFRQIFSLSDAERLTRAREVRDQIREEVEKFISTVEKKRATNS